MSRGWIALGSAWKARGWNYRGRQAYLGGVVVHRMALIEQVVAGLVIIAKQQRGR